MPLRGSLYVKQGFSPPCGWFVRCVELTFGLGRTFDDWRHLGYIAQGMSNTAIAEELVLSKGAVKKHINAIFTKIPLPEETEVSRRVVATLVYLSEQPLD